MSPSATRLTRAIAVSKGIARPSSVPEPLLEPVLRGLDKNVDTVKRPLWRKLAPKKRSPGWTFRVPRDYFKGRTVYPAGRPPYSYSRHPSDFYHLVRFPRPAPSRIAPPNLVTPDAMSSRVQILCAPTADTDGCLLVHFETGRYIFGHVSEGTTRTLGQQKIPIRGVGDIFVAGRLDWDNVGGMFGMLLSLADVGAAAQEMLREVNEKKRERGRTVADVKDLAVNVHGAQELTATLALTRHFILRRGLSLRPNAIRVDKDPRAQDPANPAPDWQDTNLRVWYVPLVSRTDLSVPTGGEEVSTQPGAPTEPRGWEKHLWKDDASAYKNSRTSEEIIEGVVQDMFGEGYDLEVLRGKMLYDVDPVAEIYVKDKANGIKRYDGPLPARPTGARNIPVLQREIQAGRLIERLPKRNESSFLGMRQSMCYIAKSHVRRGKFDPVKAAQLGVEPKDYKCLTKGDPVTLKDGTVVAPEMVMDPPRKGHGFVVMSVPDKSYIDSLLSRPEWSNPEIMDGIEVMFWLRSPEAIADPRLGEFRDRFPSLRHVVLDHDVCANRLAFETPGTQLIQFHQIDPARFPIPVFNNQPRRQVETLRTEKTSVIAGVPGAALQLAPLPSFEDNAAKPLLDTTTVLENLQNKYGSVLALGREAEAKLKDDSWLAKLEAEEHDIPDRDTEIITLGTGSAMPSKHRNVSATLVRIPGQGSWLLDCGENTLGQMRRLYGTDGLADVLKDLRGIFISHLHADHHLGILSAIKAWRDTNHPDWAAKRFGDKRLAIVAPHLLLRFLAEYHDYNNYGFPLLVALDTTGLWRPQPEAGLSRTPSPSHHKPKLYPSGLDSANDSEIKYDLPQIDICLVDHCPWATAVAFTWPSGLKIAYSGDCRPSTNLAAMGRGAHLLIHECTFEDDLLADAIAKKHSTISEALHIGRKMKARRVLLTHFSQRYPKVTSLPADAPELTADRPVLFGFDGMRVRLGEFRQAELFLPAIRCLYDKMGAEREALYETNVQKTKELKEGKKIKYHAYLAQKNMERSKKGRGRATKASEDQGHVSDGSSVAEGTLGPELSEAE
ncbi:hypothetical protein GQ53DRAFT_706268 [Thozetella sp. PMI_491]|nr:hypothetical protein GQ53DRAFT_706268 [Thozetella sp. PMI_491]